MMRKRVERHYMAGLPAAVLAVFLLAMMPALSGCTLSAPPNTDWAAPTAGAPAGSENEVQQVMDAYAAALVDKDRDAFLALIDPGDAAFYKEQAQMFDRLKEVPFARYEIDVASQSQTAPDSVTAKVETAYTFTDSFPALPDPDRSAYLLVKGDGGWRIAGDATEQALGKPRDAGLEDFGPVEVIDSGRVLVFHLASEQQTAEEVARLTEEAFPGLESALPGVELPKVPIRVFGSKEQIDQVFPGKWTEWTGGASRQMGSSADQGGEIIVDAATFSEVGSYDPAYNPKMLAHELTHVALFPMSSPRTPPFLIEGLADYVAGEDNYDLLREKMRGGESFSPTLRDLYQPGSFSALLTTEAATVAYEQADTAVALLEERYGNDSVLALMREFRRRGEDEKDQDKLVDDVFRSVLGIGWDEFEEEWRRYVLEG